MKHVPLSLNISLHLSVISILFLATISTASAQTDVRPRPGAIDVVNVRSERPQNTPTEAPPALFEKAQDVQKVERGIREVETEEVYNKVRTGGLEDDVDNKQRSFLDKARTIIKERRQEDTNLRSREENREERDVTREDQKKNRVSGFINNITRKINAAISRLEKLTERIESRIVKFEERDLDMTEARRLLGVAQDSIVSAAESITVAVERARKALEDDVSRDTFGSVVSELSKTKESLRSAHTSLIEVVRVMKGSLPDNNQRDERADDQDTDSDTETN